MGTKKKGGLGRGIGALIPPSESNEQRPVDVFFPQDTNKLQQVPGATLNEIRVDDIIPNNAQPRKNFDQNALAELTHSVREFGVLQPIVVRKLDNANTTDPHYELVMGERRLRASLAAGLKTIPAIVRHTENEAMLRDALLENLHRADLNPLEEASAYQQLLSDFGITQEQLAERIGRSRSQISNTVRLLRLPETVQKKVAAGQLTAGHARALLGLDKNRETLTSLAEEIITKNLSVRETEKAVTKALKPVKPKIRMGSVQTQLQRVEERLTDRFGTRVKLKLGPKNGQLSFEFTSIQELNGILAELGDDGLGA